MSVEFEVMPGQKFWQTLDSHSTKQFENVQSRPEGKAKESCYEHMLSGCSPGQARTFMILP